VWIFSDQYPAQSHYLLQDFFDIQPLLPATGHAMSLEGVVAPIPGVISAWKYSWLPLKHILIHPRFGSDLLDGWPDIFL